MVTYDSPLDVWCREVDIQNADKSPEWYYAMYSKMDKKIIYNLLMKDWEFRADHQGVIIASTEGETGTGKSLANLHLVIKTGKIYNKPFDIKDLIVDPSIVNDRVRKAENRTTHWVDEQYDKKVGVMSKTNDRDLTDFENQGRYTQKNMFWCSKDLKQHAHTFIFRTYKINRRANAKCEACKIQHACKSNYISTMCETPFWERSGYPESFLLELYTKRRKTSNASNSLVLRGILDIPMVHHETAVKYDVVKKKMIDDMQKRKRNMWTLIKDDAVKAFENNKDSIIKVKIVKDKENYSVESALFVEGVIYDEYGVEKYPRDVVKLMVAQIKKMAQEEILRLK